MNAIIPFPSSAGTNIITMSSREIAELMGKEHKNVVRDIRAMFDGLKIEPVGFEALYTDAKGQDRTCFNLPHRETLILVSGYSFELRARIIDRWKELEEAVAGPRVPQTFAEALRLAADKSEEVERQKQEIARQERQLEIAAPKVDFVDRYVQSTGLMGFREVCKTLRVKEPVFRDFLEQKRVMYRKGSGRKVRWYPYADHLKAGRFEVKTKIVAGTDRTMVDVYFTAEGFHHFGKMWARSQDTGVAFFG